MKREWRAGNRGGWIGAIAGVAVGVPLGVVIPGLGALLGAALFGVAGSVFGGALGAAVMVDLHPEQEERYWREHFFALPYAAGTSYSDFAPAFRYGWESRARYRRARAFEEVEPRLRRKWTRARAGSRLEWPRARPAVRDAWRRAQQRVGPPQGDGAPRG